MIDRKEAIWEILMYEEEEREIKEKISLLRKRLGWLKRQKEKIYLSYGKASLEGRV